jgi:hypothetical protein
MKSIVVAVATALLVAPGGAASAQDQQPPAKDSRDISFGVVPGPFFNPNLGVGLTVYPLLTFHMSKDDAVSPPSVATLPLMYAILPPLDEAGTRYSYAFGGATKIYLDEDRWRLQGLVGYANLYRRFAGIGGDTSGMPEFAYREMVGIVLAQVMRQLGWRPLYGGLILGYVAFRDETSDPENQAILDMLGTKSTWTGQFNWGITLEIDTRDNQYYPSSGLDCFVRTYASLASGAQYLVLQPNLSQFFSLHGGNRLVLAYQLFMQFGFGDVPLTYYANYGSRGTTLGYSQGEYADKMMAGLDVELRWLFWWRLGLQAGGGIGKVFPSFDGFGPQPWLPSGWVGLLYKVMDDSDIRVNLTAAVGNSGGALYFGIGQTF